MIHSTSRRFSLFTLCIIAAAFFPSQSAAQSCDAWFKFDGNLSDASGNGYDGTMVGREGMPALPQFSAGVEGQALHVEGNSAMRAYLDLSYELCPKVTVAGWIRVEANKERGTQYIISTGNSSGPGLRSSGVLAGLNGNGNGLMHRTAIRDDRAWFFFAGVYDYETRSYRFHWRDRVIEGELPENPRLAQDAFWVGAFNDDLDYAVKGAHIDELRVIGRALSAEEVMRLKGARPAAFVRLEGAADGGSVAVADSGTGFPQAVPGISDQLSGPAREIDPDVLPERPPDLLSGGLADTAEDPPLLEVPNEVMDANAGLTDPGLTPLEPLPAAPTGPLTSVPQPYDPIMEVPDEVLDARQGLQTPDITMPETPASELQDQLQTIAENPPPPGPPNEAIVCDTPGTPILRATIAGDFPADFLGALTQARNCGEKVTVASLNSNDQWVVSTPTQIAWSDNVPSEMATKLAEFENNYGGLDAADIAEAGAWVMVSGVEFAEAGLPAKAINRLEALPGSFRRAASFDFHPQDNSKWVFVDSDGTISGDGLAPTLLDEMSHFAVSKRVSHQVKYTPDGQWVMVGNDLWFSTNNVRREIISDMSAIRRSGRRIDLVVFNDNQSDYMILSSGPEPERSLDPIYLLEQNMASSNIWERRFRHKLRGVSVAIVRNNAVIWSRGYGVRNENLPESWVRPDTTFDVASVSKPISAFGIMQLVQAGKMNLEQEGVLEDIETLIPSINRPGYRDRVRPEVSNLVQVLQHCASICYEYRPDCGDPDGSGGGAGEYGTSDDLPSVQQMIRGRGPAKSNRRLFRTGNDGLRHGYSSAYYMLVQGLIDVHGGGFLNHMDKLLSDLDMRSTTYRTPYPGRFDGNFARGHDSGLNPTYAYPEMAAASLVSTSADVAKFVIALNRNGSGLLSSQSFNKFVGRDSSVLQYCNDAGNMALGINRVAVNNGWGGNETIWHHGDHNGYHAKMVALPGINSGIVVIMTGTGSDSNNFWGEIRSSFLAAYGITGT